MMGFPGKIFRNENVPLSKMNMDAISEEKNYLQDLAELWPKTEFMGCQILLKSFQILFCRGSKSGFKVSNM
jgi:hypothetical protein